MVVFGPLFEHLDASEFKILLISLIVISTGNSILDVAIFYSWSSADYPMDASKVLLITGPFFLSAAICIIF